MKSNADGRADLVKRDDQGLMPVQAELLDGIAEHGNWRDAASALQIKEARVRRWLREDKAFRNAYDLRLSETVEVARRHMNVLAEKATAVADDLLDELKPLKVKVTCNDCGGVQTVTVQVRDAGVRAKIVEMIMKGTGILKDIRKVEGSIVHMTAGQRIALAMLRAGKPISEQSRRELEDMGILSPEGEMQRQGDDDVIEGISREV